MAKTQTRRTISFNRPIYDALSALASDAGVSLSEFVTTKLRAAGVSLPKAEHMDPRAVRRAVIGRILARKNRENGWVAR